jgi:hypothetical protein
MEVLQTIFPEIFEDRQVFVEIGSIFFRKDYPNNVYAVMKKGTEVVVMNITYCTIWNYKSRTNRKLELSELLDIEQSCLTITEFKKLTGYKNLANFLVVPKAFNSRLVSFTGESKKRMI